MNLTLVTAGARLSLRTRGTGPPIVLLHGGPGAYDYLGDSILADWLAADFTVVSYDQRGCRHSASPGPFTVAANVADLDALREHLGVPTVSLFGHSWGGMLALQYAAAHPPSVRRLILIGSVGPRRGWRAEFFARLDTAHTPAQRAALAALDARIAHTFDRATRARLYHQRFNVALPSYLSPAHRHAAPRMEFFSRDVNTQTMNDVQRLLTEDCWHAGLAALRAPTLIIHGADDPIPKRVIDDLRRLIPHAQTALFPDCGHFPWLETPDALRAALSAFLECAL